MDSMLEAFIGEARENLETAGRCFLELEKQPGDDELMNDLFRAIHTIKGSSGLFDIPSFTKVVHVAEDVLDRARGGELELNSEHIDLFLDTMDQINIWLDDLELNEQLGDNAEELSLNLAQALRDLLGADTAQTEEAEEALDPEIDVDQPLNEAPAWIAQMPEPLRVDLFKQDIAQNSGVWSIEYDPDAQCFFSGEDPLHTMRNLPGIAWFQIQVKDPWPPTDELDPYHCNLVFRGVANIERTELHHYLRYIPEQVQLTPFSALDLVFPRGDYGDSEPFLSFIQDAQQAIETETWDEMERLITPLLQFSGPDLLQTSALNWMDALLKQDVPHVGLLNALLATLATGKFSRPDVILEETTTFPAASEPAVSNDENSEPQSSSSPALNASKLAASKLVVETQRLILSLPCAAGSLAGRIASTGVVLKNLLSSLGQETIPIERAVREAQEKETLAPLVEFLATLSTDFAPQDDPDFPSELPSIAASSTVIDPSIQEERAQGDQRQGDRRQGDRRQGDRRTDGFQPEAGQAADQHRVIKVDQQRIDALMDLVGELVVAKNALPFLARRADEDFGVRELSKEIQAQYAVINRLSDELQSAMMQIRMVPVSSVFQRFPRLVRDLSRKLNKRIELVLEGEETEADKNVVENLSDPLIHLVRNSLDHGLESIAEREVAGKSPVGTITLRAIPHDDQVVIEIIDDGHGIDPEVIKRKAYEKGLIDEHQLDSISDQDALQLIFAAGLSTAEQISDLSGRGVGMDVVRSVISNAGGSVSAESVIGQGTTIRLALPLSMAVSHVMMIETAEQTYGIPMNEIVETVRIPARSIRRIKQSEAVVLRDQLTPLFHLRRLLNLSSVDTLPDEVAVLVMNSGGQQVGLIIEEFLEGIDIIQKPLEGIMARYPYYSGAALLGDGRVLLVLNIQEVLACR